MRGPQVTEPTRRLSHGGATITELAEHLDVTRQAAAQLADELVAKGY